MSSARESVTPSAPASAPDRRVLLALHILLALLVAKRLAYHLSYLVHDPFALATFSDGQLYEDAARDILAHPPLGTQPFYLQGLYAYMLALPLSLAGAPVLGLLLQLVLAAGALLLFHRVARDQLGVLAGGLSTACLLACPELAFFENKYLSVALGVACNALALFLACRALRDPRKPALLWAGFGAGLAVLGRPNLAVALPFTAAALALPLRERGRALAGGLALLGLGVLLALAPMALRNQLVIGHPDVFPSHGGAIPFFIGNNPHANGRWNTAGGLLSGQVGRERVELARRLGVKTADEGDLDHAIGAVLGARALRFIREQPLVWLGLEAKKLWLTLGDHRFVRDYDLRGEAELVGGAHELGLPFGVALGLGAIGLLALRERGRRVPAERTRMRALCLLLVGQLAAVLAANVVVFSSSQNRVPALLPLCFAAGPALLALLGLLARRPLYFRAGSGACALGALLFVQALWPRGPQPSRPSSVHYFNLGAVEEALQRDEAAAEHYARAVARQPKQPVFLLSQARVLRKLGRAAQARALLDRLDVLPDEPRDVRAAAAAERALLQEAPPRR